MYKFDLLFSEQSTHANILQESQQHSLPQIDALNGANSFKKYTCIFNDCPI